MAHWICRAIASEREFMVFVMVLVAAATFLTIGAIAAWMSLVGPRLPTSSGGSGATAIEGATDARLAVQELQKMAGRLHLR
jgi:hypothetical protein